MQFDVNCDLGEGESPRRTLALMRSVSSANVACGGHAGDVETMRGCVRLAKKFGARLGAHPGAPSPSDFGRGTVVIDGAGLETLLLQQVGALERIAQSEKVKLHHIKLHGGLYHATERDAKLARAYLEIVRQNWPRLIVYGFAGGNVARRARAAGVEVWQEAFLDRNYRDDGSLVPRTEPDALLTRRGELIGRMRLLMERSAVTTVTRKALHLPARTICVHSDTPHAARTVGMARMCGLTESIQN